MATKMATKVRTVERVQISPGWEITAWKWMRYSGLLLIPLAWFHVAIQDVIVGVHRIDLDYVQMRWASVAWRTYDFALLAFAFAHGVNGLRQVLFDYVRGEQNRRRLSWALLIFWFILSLIGAAALIGGVRSPAA
jgi:succinate dehydrogenase / fumarate reductase membrane anchor subunit